jgi:glycosyltransferase involved in cell wall biosynthesis
MSKQKIAFVTPWFGPDIPGGMENAAYQTVRALHKAGLPVEVLTTTIKDFYGDWGRNGHKPGRVLIDEIPVHRFPVQPRDKAAFDAVNYLLMNNRPVTDQQAETFFTQMIRTPALYDHIATHQEAYIFFFIPYMFATSVYGAIIAPERSVLIPCLHDESYAYLERYAEMAGQVRGIGTFVEVEQQLAARLFSSRPEQISRVLGLGVRTDFTADGERFQAKYGLTPPFVLYAGRKEPGKNVPLLLNYWQRFKQQGGPGKLVLIGSGEMSLPAGSANQIVDLGFVPRQDKYDAYAAATLLCQPSTNESFSFVIMESWLAGTPVLVHGDCPVTVEHVRKGNGGLYFTNYAEFAATITYLFHHPHTARQMADQGRRYVYNNYTWEKVTGRYQALIADIVAALERERVSL